MLSSEEVLRIVTTMFVSGWTFQIWETLITFEDEVTYIWRNPSTRFVKSLYFILRYYPNIDFILIMLFSPQFLFQLDYPNSTCKLTYIIRTLFQEVAVCAFGVILIMRVYALWQQSRWILSILVALFALERVSVGFALIYNLHIFKFDSACHPIGAPAINAFAIVQVVLLVTHILILCLTLKKTAENARLGGRRSPVFYTLARDGVYACLTIISVVLIIGVVTIVWKSQLTAITASIYVPATSCAGCRLLINMQRLACVEDRGDSALSLTTEFEGSWETQDSMVLHPRPP